MSSSPELHALASAQPEMPHSQRFSRLGGRLPFAGEAHRLEKVWAAVLCNLDLYQRLEDPDDSSVQFDDGALAAMRPLVLETQ